MAKKLITKYVFTPGIAGAGTIRIPGRHALEKLLLITNVTMLCCIILLAAHIQEQQ